MRIRPRQQILDIWAALLACCWDGKNWSWAGRDAEGEPLSGGNSISDSEQLLCLLYPATEIESLALDRPDDMADDVRAVLEPLGGQTRIGSVVVRLLEEYIERNTKPDGTPDFSAGDYLRGQEDLPPVSAQRAIEVVDSYSMSTTLCIAGLGFLRVFEIWVRSGARDELVARIELLRSALSARLTAAMAGLVRSFVVHTATPKSPAGQNMLRMLNPAKLPERVVVDKIAQDLERVRNRLRSDISLGQSPDTELDDEGKLFECGWSWGIVENSSEIIDAADIPIAKQQGYAEARPFLYFTIIALDGINDLISPRTRELNLLNEDQRRLTEALRLRWDLTQGYWSTIARFGDPSWPLEDIPWRTSDGEESDYFSLIVSAVLIQDLIRRAATDDDLTRSIGVFDELARRGRILRRATRDDPAVALHTTGVGLALRGSEKVGEGPELRWMVSDFAAVLLKRVLQAAHLSGNIGSRDRLMELAKSVMDHLDSRVLRSAFGKGLWDNPTAIFDPGSAEPTHPSWYMTERVVECLVAADRNFREAPLTSPAMINRAVELLNEAEHLLNQELLNVGIDDVSEKRVTLDRVENNLEQARQLVARRQAGTAFVLASDALRDLNQLAFARRDATRSVYS
ncbi:SCO2524 family protein [Nocardia sp. NPDC057227]|uniref:SCO2524 family protein n=1 Tax=Nocardia sp. NPDC057227 TaxID=3346056 RepID=UPI003629E8B2